MKRLSIAIVAVTSAALLAGCGSARVVQRSPDRPVRPTAPVAPPVRVSQPKYGATYVVQRGDNVYRIATNNGITALDLALWNAIPPPYTIHPGQRLRLYPGAAPVATAPPSQPAGTSRPSVGAPPVAPSRATPPPVAPAAPVPSTVRWQWPASGGLLSRYANGDPTRQGIDIGGSAGAPVRSAADGVVVYSGSGLVGYGELIIVKHTDQWLSAYGHNRARLVNEGAVVKAGQQIAELGRTGTDREKLHFEIRLNGKPVDPLLYLPAR